MRLFINLIILLAIAFAYYPISGLYNAVINKDSFTKDYFRGETKPIGIVLIAVSIFVIGYALNALQIFSLTTNINALEGGEYFYYCTVVCVL